VHESYELGDLILRRLGSELRISSDEFAALKAAKEKNPFKVLIATILSQNTTEKNTFRALQRLEEEVGVSPFTLSKVDVEELARVISPAGLQQQKAEAIVSLSKLLVENYGGGLERLLEKGEEEVREELSKIKGIGDKTIDVLLANTGFPVVPVDTHVKRVARRLGLTRSNAYSRIKMDLHKVFRPERRLEAHLLLIKLGREVCKARNPKCEVCPLRDICEYAKAKR